ncbi:MAG: FG-GAP-like repeat-containing protein [Actinobacteria bacterium]|nr:FG-GAP-like repeat-containing protein [Actinomycetota bacterium]MCL5882956.1 FG-GAP-like repeat-containing protein [Actinomycetota bacterium]
MKISFLAIALATMLFLVFPAFGFGAEPASAGSATYGTTAGSAAGPPMPTTGEIIAPTNSPDVNIEKAAASPGAGTATLDVYMQDSSSGQSTSPDASGQSSTQNSSQTTGATPVEDSAASSVYLPPGSVDVNGDGKDEIAILYDYGNSNTGLWIFDPVGDGYGAPRLVWASGPGNWEWSRSKLSAVDYNGDGKTDLAVLYDYGNSNTGLWIFDPVGDGYAAPRRVWLSGAGNWDWNRSKPQALDVNGDGKSELAVLYDYGHSESGLWLFDPDSTGYSAPRRVWLSGQNNWDWWRSKLTAVDVNGDGKDEVAVLYNYDHSESGLWLFDPSGSGYSAPRSVWLSGQNNWDWGRSKLQPVDVNGDGLCELGVLYDYGNGEAGVWLFDPSGTGYSAPHRVWLSGAGNWDWSRSKLTAADPNGDGKTELVILYDYSHSETGLWIFSPSGSGYTAPARSWLSGAGNWEWQRTKLPQFDIMPFVIMGLQYIDINLSTQVLTAVGLNWSTLIASGGPGYETPTGMFYVYSKNMYIDMSGPGYYAPDVPFVLWFTGPYSIHGTYWHNLFGVAHSHGCVNLPTPAAAWLFDRAPVGTPVYVHY